MAFSELLVDALTAFIEDLGLLGIFLTMAAESCLIPIPSEVVMPFAGYVAWLKSSELFLGYSVAAATIGNLLGSTILYYIGLRLGKAFIEKYGKYFLLRRREVELAERWFLKYGGYAVFFGRMTPAIRTVISLPAGLFEFDFKKFAVLTLIGSIPWNLFLVYLGYLSGPYWKMILEYSTFIDVAAVIGLAVFLLLIFWKTRRNLS
ncbi:MAG: DedA family protein [Thaumarchaeota archaeon]|nr:DedA family protein [Nitrososphaerota archaeon]